MQKTNVHKYIKKFLLIFIINTLFLGVLKAESMLEKLLPDSIYGWTRTGKDRYYDPESLYDYINGGAELFISYGFKEVISRTYSKDSQPDIKVDIFDMITSKNAFGVFTHSRESVEFNYGQGSQYFGGAILFWKDHYYISIIAHVENEESAEAIKMIAEEIDKSIPTQGELPDVLDLIPENALVRESVLYFHHYSWLNSYYYISDENIFNINKTTGAVLAKYGNPENRYYLLIVRYPDEKEAGSAFNNFTDVYFDKKPDSNLIQTEDNKWMAFELKKDYIICIFNAASREDALGLIEEPEEEY